MKNTSNKLIVFLALSSGMTFFLGRFFERDQADLTAFFAWHPWLFLILMPAIGMRLWAEERRSGTIELLMTLPVTNSQLVVGKFFASWVFTLIALLLSTPIWITVNYLGNPDNNVIFISYLTSWLMAGAFLALTSCLSTLTKNQVIAFIISSISGFILIMAGFSLVLSTVRSWAPIWITETIGSMSFLSHFSRVQMGVFDLSTLIFLPLISSFFIFLSRGQKNNSSAIYISLFSSLATFILSLFIWYSLDLKSADWRDHPAIHPNYLATKLDQDTIVKGIQIARRIAQFEPLKSHITEEFTPGAEIGMDDYDATLNWARDNSVTIYHPTGTCKMGQDEMAVVDADLKVRGIKGLRVADCSIMPTITSGNTNAPAIMIGEKLSDMILEDAS